MSDEIDPTSYARRSGDYVYDVTCYRATLPAKHARFCALVVNMSRLQRDGWVPVHPRFQAEYGETRADAIGAMSKAVDEWVRTRPD